MYVNKAKSFDKVLVAGVETRGKYVHAIKEEKRLDETPFSVSVCVLSEIRPTCIHWNLTRQDMTFGVILGKK